jgi:hypothetical protein
MAADDARILHLRERRVLQVAVPPVVLWEELLPEEQQPLLALQVLPAGRH